MSHFYPWGYWFLKSGGGVELEIKKQVFIIFFRPFSSFFSSLPHPCLILASSLSHPFSFFFLLTYPLVKKIIFKWEIHYVKSCIRNKHCSSVSLKPVHCTTSYRCFPIWKIHPAFLLTISRSWVWKVSYLFRGK